jgi:hypothetical protein
MDYGLKHKLGNLLTDSYESLHESDYFKKILNREIETICDECNWRCGL